jgi:hypothetical protein
MWGKKRERYVFRKRSRRGPISGLLVGTLILVGLVWFVPWQTFSLVGVQDMLKSETSTDQAEQAPVENEPKQPDTTQDQAEQVSTSDQPTNEALLEGAPPSGEVATNSLPSPSPPAAQLSPPPQAPSTPGLEGAPQNSVYPNDYWYPEANYWYSGADYWDSDWDYSGSYYYWD